MSKAELTRNLPARYKELCLDLSARIGSGSRRSRRDEGTLRRIGDEERATDRWGNEGGRGQLAQQEEVDLTLSRVPPQLSLEVNNGSADVSEANKLLGHGLSLAGQRAAVITRLSPCNGLGHKELPKVADPLIRRSPKITLICSATTTTSSGHSTLREVFSANAVSLAPEKFSPSCSRTPISTVLVSDNTLGGPATPEGKAPLR